MRMGLDGQEWELQKGKGKLSGVMDMFIFVILMMVSWVNTCVKNCTLKYVLFIVCQFYLN